MGDYASFMEFYADRTNADSVADHEIQADKNKDIPTIRVIRTDDLTNNEQSTISNRPSDYFWYNALINISYANECRYIEVYTKQDILNEILPKNKCTA